MGSQGQEQRARDEIKARLTRLRKDAERQRGGRTYTWSELADLVNAKIRSHDGAMAAARGELPSQSSVEDRETVSAQQIGFWFRDGKRAKHIYQLWALVLVLHEDAGLRVPTSAYTDWKGLWDQAQGEPVKAGRKTAPTAGSGAPDSLPPSGGLSMRRQLQWGALLGVVVIGGAVLGLTNPWHWQWLGADSAASSSELGRTYDPNSPVVVQGVHADREGLHFVVAEKLSLSRDELRVLSQEATRSPGANQKRFEAQHDGIPQDFANLVMTVSTNLDQPVTITGLRAIKECADPFDGTYFDEYTQGGSTPNVEIGIDLDKPDAQAQYLDEHGHPTGPLFFRKQNVQLKPGDSTTLSIAVFTAKYGCSFKLEITVDTPTGPVTQVIDNNGKPFKVTAKAAPKKDGFPLSGYQAAYVQQVGYVWQAVDPNTFRGR